MLHSRDGQNEYNWGKFGLMDEIAKRFWTGKARTYVLDMSALNYRVDAHPGSPGARGTGLHGVGDCLHLCDGPLRLGAVLLLNIFAQMKRESAPTQRASEMRRGSRIA